MSEPEIQYNPQTERIYLTYNVDVGEYKVYWWDVGKLSQLEAAFFVRRLVEESNGRGYPVKRSPWVIFDGNTPPQIDAQISHISITDGGKSGLWKCTPELRWHCKHIWKKKRRYKRMVLQQLWHEVSTGEIEWRDIPEQWEVRDERKPEKKSV